MPEIEIPEIREIAPPLPPDDSWPLYVWILLALAALLLAVAVFQVIRKYRSRPALARELDARESALTKLHEIKECDAAYPANEFALRASDALREYLTGFYGSTTPFETGREFLDRQNESQLMDADKFDSIAGLLERAEAMKYAGRARPPRRAARAVG